MGDMKEIRDASLAYYRNLSREKKDQVGAFFQRMDADGDGEITIKEFEQIFGNLLSHDYIIRLFQEMDKNGDGTLDFEETITVYYVLANRGMVFCHGNQCKVSFIKGLYFTCIDCFDGMNNTFDLCISCYSSRNYVHEHCNFLDNYVLLRTKRASANQQTSPEEPTEASDYSYQIPRSKYKSEASDYSYQIPRSKYKSEASDYSYQIPRSKYKSRAALGAINTTAEIGNTVTNVANTAINVAQIASSCIIM